MCRNLTGSGLRCIFLISPSFGLFSCWHSDHTDSVAKHWPAWVILQVGIWRHSKDMQCEASNCRCRIAKRKVVLCASFFDSSAPESSSAPERLPGIGKIPYLGICLPFHQVFHTAYRGTPQLYPNMVRWCSILVAAYHESLRIVMPKYREGGPSLIF